MHSKVFYGEDSIATVLAFFVAEPQDLGLPMLMSDMVEPEVEPPSKVELALVDLQVLEDVTIVSPTTMRNMSVARRVSEAATTRQVVLAANLGNHIMTMDIGDRVHVMSADFSFHPVYGGTSGTARYAKDPSFHTVQF